MSRAELQTNFRTNNSECSKANSTARVKTFRPKSKYIPEKKEHIKDPATTVLKRPTAVLIHIIETLDKKEKESKGVVDPVAAA